MEVKHSVNYGYGGEDGYALREAGINEHYGCLESKVIESVEVKGSFLEEGELIPVAVLFGIGKFDDPEVILALNRTCGNCSYFQERHRVS